MQSNNLVFWTAKTVEPCRFLPILFESIHKVYLVFGIGKKKERSERGGFNPFHFRKTRRHPVLLVYFPQRPNPYSQRVWSYFLDRQLTHTDRLSEDLLSTNAIRPAYDVYGTGSQLNMRRNFPKFKNTRAETKPWTARQTFSETHNGVWMMKKEREQEW
jgi:hypothetical protein